MKVYLTTRTSNKHTFLSLDEIYSVQTNINKKIDVIYLRFYSTSYPSKPFNYICNILVKFNRYAIATCNLNKYIFFSKIGYFN